MRYGEILRVVEASNNYAELSTDLTDYKIDEYPVGTKFQVLFADAYPEDDPGWCMYEYFEPIKA